LGRTEPINRAAMRVRRRVVSTSVQLGPVRYLRTSDGPAVRLGRKVRSRLAPVGLWAVRLLSHGLADERRWNCRMWDTNDF
jgi:hypothetical protein